jgi:nicotinate-nucleotide adenylyltransferase
MQKTEIGLLFGSFNPIHIGHTAVANYILEYSDISEIWFIVSPRNPFKQEAQLANEKHRLQMTEIGIAQEPRFKVSDVEFNLTRPSYTINTLETLSARYSHINFVILMGSDNYLNIAKWKDGNKILDSYNIIVYPRSGYSVFMNKLTHKTKLIDAPLLDVSSTLIRNSIAEGKRLHYFLHPGVFQFIGMHGLYRKN